MRRFRNVSPISIRARPRPCPGKKFEGGFPPDFLKITEVSFLEDAFAEYEAGFEWYFLRSEFVASNFVEELNRAVYMIANDPQRWPIASHGTRKFVLRRFPYSVLYREIPSGIQVLAVAHAKRKPGYWKRRF